jgi:hypothetical protein
MKPTSTPKPLPRLTEIEREVVAESRAWGRQRLQENNSSMNPGRSFPLKQRRRRLPYASILLPAAGGSASFRISISIPP